MPKSYLETMLGAREKIEYVTRQHWFLLVSAIFFEIVLILILLATTVTAALLFPPYAMLSTAIGFALILIPMFTMLRDILSWTNHQYIVTNRRVIQLSGVLDKTVSDSSLEKVNDVRLTQSALGRIFDYGDIEILTASELGVNLFKRLKHPVQFKTAMLNAKEVLESGESFRLGEAEASGLTGGAALLAQIDALRQQGILTEAEFQAKKAQILAKL